MKWVGSAIPKQVIILMHAGNLCKRKLLWLGMLVSLVVVARADTTEYPTVRLERAPCGVVERGSTVEVSGTCESQRIRSVHLLLDRREYASKEYGGAYRFLWRTSSADLGLHTLDVVAVHPDGAKELVRRARVEVVGTAPVTISTPSPTVALGAPCPVSVVSHCSLRPTHATLIVDRIPEAQEQPLAGGCVQWDCTKVRPGEHTLGVRVRDGDNWIACSRDIRIRVPEGLVIDLPDTVRVTQDNPDIRIGVRIAEGLAVKKLSVTWDSKRVVEVDRRVDELRWSGLSTSSGRKSLYVELLDTAGRSFTFGPKFVQVVNVYQEEQIEKRRVEQAAKEAAARAEREKAERQAAEALAALKARQEAERKRQQFRERIRAMLSSDASRQQHIQAAYGRAALANSGGRVGSVRGMCVVCVGGVYEFGSVKWISARASAGTGRVSANRSTDSAFRSAMRCARDVAARYLASMGMRVNWERIDVAFEIGGQGELGGDSAGVAMATALISYMLKVPVRNEVVITGALDASGVVRGVGGVSLKSAAALRDPSVLTVIVPESSGNAAEVFQLPPEMLVGHRVVAAANMHEVLRQALVGYDQESLKSACDLFQMAMRRYAEGDINGAVNLLKQAQRCTPEDLCLPAWIRFMQSQK